MNTTRFSFIHFSPIPFVQRAARPALALLLCGTGVCALAADEPIFPAPDQTWIREGSFASPETVRSLMPGLTREQVYSLIGAPHFAEGGLYMREWNYLLNQQIDGRVVACQLLLRWDDDRRVESMHWKEPDCAQRFGTR